jgi:hypothetical protein
MMEHWVKEHGRVEQWNTGRMGKDQKNQWNKYCEDLKRKLVSNPSFDVS